VYLLSEFEKLASHVSSTTIRDALTSIKKNSLIMVKDYYSELFENKYLKIKEEFKVRAEHVCGVNEKKHFRQYFKQPVKNKMFHARVIRYFEDFIQQVGPVSPNVFRNIKNKQIDFETVLYYAGLHNLSFCIWRKESDKNRLQSGCQQDFRHASDQLHLLEEDNNYYVLEENMELREEYVPDPVGVDVDVSINTSESVLLFRKNILRISEIINSPGFNAKLKHIKELRIYAEEELHIDADLTCPGINVVIVSRNIIVSSNTIFNIDTSGKNSETLAKAGAGGESKRKNPAKPFGLDGEDGECGEPGGSAGHIYITADAITNLANLRLELNGGKGADGAIGGAGDEGKPGKNGLPGENTDKMSRLDFTPKFSITRGAKAKPGQNGGNGGCGGKGGVGGNFGTVKIICASLSPGELQQFEAIHIKNSPGDNGIDGRRGDGGRGGLEGEDGNDHGKAWQSYLYIKERIQYGVNLEKIDAKPTFKYPPIDFEPRGRERPRSRRGKNGDELVLQQVARQPQAVLAPLMSAEIAAANLFGEMDKEKEEIHGKIEKMLSRLQGGKQKIHHKINAPFKAEKIPKKSLDSKKPIENIISIVDETDQTFQKTKSQKDSIIRLYGNIKNYDIQKIIEGILEWVDSNAQSYFVHTKALLELMHDHYIKNRISVSQLLLALHDIQSDIEWLQTLGKKRIRLLKKLKVSDEKSIEIVSRYDGLAWLYALRVNKLKPGQLRKILEDEGYGFFHIIAKKAFSTEIYVEKVLVRIKANLLYEDLTVLNGRVYDFFDSQPVNFLKACKKSEDEQCLDEIFQFVPEQPAVPDFTHLKKDATDFGQHIKYLLKLHQAATAMPLIQQYVTSVSLQYFQGYTKNHCEMLCRLMRSPLFLDLCKTIFPKLSKVISENELKQIFSKHTKELFEPQELFLNQFVLKHFPNQTKRIIQLIEEYPVCDWVQQLQCLSQTLMIEKIGLHLKPCLEKTFKKAIQQNQYEYWLKSVAYCISKSYIRLNENFIRLMSEVDDKNKLFDILTHSLPQNWVRNLLLQCISEYLDVMMGDKQQCLAIMTQLISANHSETFLIVLNNKLRKELTQVKPSLRISVNKLNEILDLVSDFSARIPELLPDLNQRPFFTWPTLFKREDKKIRREEKKRLAGDEDGKPRSLKTLIALLKLKDSTQKIKTLIDSMEEKIKKILTWREHYKNRFQTVADIKVWCQEANHCDSEWIKAHKEEVIAVISHAVRLTSSKKSYPYDTQYITLIMLLEGGTEGKGLLGRVATNEGKTLIAAMFALYNALMGDCVDVVTSSSELAKAGAEKNRLLFESMNVTVSVNCSDECKKNPKARRQAYQSQVVYGDVGSFEHDYLLSTLHKQDILGNRQVDVVLVDEVDNMLLDKSEHVLYLSHEMPDFRHLRMFYVTIWNLYHATHAIHNDDERKACIKKEIEARVQQRTLIIPFCLQGFVDRRLSLWIDNAFIADRIVINDNYSIFTDPQDSGKAKIVIMDKDTGVEQFNMTWENGLHQFLELKHQKRLSNESLKSVFISNFSYFKKFQGKIYGFSGTLGSEQEQALMSSVYDVEFFSIPRLKARQFTEEDPILVGEEADDQWLNEITNDVMEKVNQGRPVLVLCDNRADVKSIKKALRKIYSEKDKIYSYSRTSKKIKFLHETDPEPMKAGDVLIATNLGGRGADLGVDDEAVKKGLHEILTFMPPNRRIEKQDFARVARRGEPGSARFIIKTEFETIEESKQWRDLQEEVRLESFRQLGLFSQVLEEELLNNFMQLSEVVVDVLSQLDYPSAQFKNEYIQIQLKSLQDEWALWFDENKERIKNAGGSSAEVYNEYNNFEFKMRKKLHNKLDFFKFVRLPHELIRLGFFYLEHNQDENAITSFERVIQDEPHYAEIAHYYIAYVLSRENQRSFLSNHENDPVIRQRILKELKLAHALLEKRKDSLATMGAMRKATVEAQCTDGVGLQSNEIDQQLLNECKIFTIHLNAIKRAIGSEVDEGTFLGLEQIKNQEHLKLLFEKVTAVKKLMKPLRISKKVKITDADIVKARGGVEQKIGLPTLFLSSQQNILRVLREKASSDVKDIEPADFENPAVFPVLVNLGVVKPRRVKLSLNDTQTKKEIEEKLDEIKVLIKDEVEGLFKENVEKDSLSPGDVSQGFFRKKVDQFIENKNKNQTIDQYTNAIFGAIKLAAGELRTIPQFKIELSDMEKYFSTGELPPEIRDFQEMLFDKLLGLDFDKSLWSWEAFAIAMFGVAQIAGGVALQVATYGVGALAGGVLISQGIGDVLFAIRTGLSGTFTWDAYFKYKAQSLLLTLAFAGIGGAIGGVFTSASGFVTTIPATVIIKQVCIETGIKLATTLGCAVAFKGLEQIAGQLPSLISSSLGEKLQAKLTQKLISSPVLGELKTLLSELYAKKGVIEGNKKFEELCGQMENNKNVIASFLEIAAQMGCEFAVQALRVLEQINIGNGKINWVVLGGVARFCLESTIDLSAISRLIKSMMTEVEALPSKLREYTTALPQSKEVLLSAKDIEHYSKKAINNFQATMVKEMLDKIINTVIKQRLETYMFRAFRKISTSASSALQAKYSYSSKVAAPASVNGNDVEAGDQAQSIAEASSEVAEVIVVSSRDPAEHQLHTSVEVHVSGYEQKEHQNVYSSGAKYHGLFKQDYNKAPHHHHHHHGKLHHKPLDPMVITSIALSTGTTIINAINSLQKGITKYRLACIELKKLKIQAETLRTNEEAARIKDKVKFLEEEAKGYQEETVAMGLKNDEEMKAMNYQAEIEKINISILEKQIEIDRLNIKTKMQFITRLEGSCVKDMNKDNIVRWLESQLKILDEVNVEIVSGSAELIDLFKSICEEINKKHDNVLGSPDQFLLGLISQDIQEISILERDEKVLREALRQRENRMPVAPSRR
jgi:hypothetical protein